jgi:hypothetical protein
VQDDFRLVAGHTRRDRKGVLTNPYGVLLLLAALGGIVYFPLRSSAACPRSTGMNGVAAIGGRCGSFSPAGCSIGLMSPGSCSDKPF